MGPLPNRGFRLLYTLYANILRRGHGHDCLDDRLHRRRLLGRRSRRRHAECILRGFGGRADRQLAVIGPIGGELIAAEPVAAEPVAPEPKAARIISRSSGGREPEGAGPSPLNSVSDSNMCPTENRHFFT